MTRLRIFVCVAFACTLAIGCGAEPKKIPEPTAEQKAEFSKQHEEAKAASQAQQPAPGGGAAEPPK